MYYKINKSTELFKKLTEIKEKAIVCDKEARKIVVSFGAEHYIQSSFYLGGDICGIKLPEKPEGWKMVESGYYLPKRIKANKEINDKIDALEKVPQHHLKRELGLDMFSGYKIKLGSEEILFAPTKPLNDNAPLSDMQEILGSEFEKLYNED
jgi:hypothetical protein